MQRTRLVRVKRAAVAHVLIVDDEVNIRRVLAAMLKREGYEVTTAADGEQALGVLQKTPVHVVVTDLVMPRLGGMELLRRVAAEFPDVPVIVITAHGSVDSAVAALKAGAFDYITKPFEQDELKKVIAKAARAHDLERQNVHANFTDGDRPPLVGESPAMKAIYDIVAKVADSPSTVLITGESGTGKELIAKALHRGSSRRDKPFIKVNCAAIPKDLVESELFGYERGAFTGAVGSKPGRFELADGGTLFLDEIGEMPVEMQVKLLRALQESEFERVGGIKTLRVDVRLIAATNRDLKAAHRRREVPRGPLLPARRRPDRAAAAARAARGHPAPRPPLHRRSTTSGSASGSRGSRTRRCSSCSATPGPGTSASSRTSWSGRCSSPTARSSSPRRCPTRSARARRPAARADRRRWARSAPSPRRRGASMKEIVRHAQAELEKELIARALEETGGNVTRAAKRLQISRKSLQVKMKELGLRGTSEGEE